MSKNLAHPLHPIYNDGKGGGWKWRECHFEFSYFGLCKVPCKEGLRFGAVYLGEVRINLG